MFYKYYFLFLLLIEITTKLKITITKWWGLQRGLQRISLDKTFYFVLFGVGELGSFANIITLVNVIILLYYNIVFLAILVPCLLTKKTLTNFEHNIFYLVRVIQKLLFRCSKVSDPSS